MSKLDDEALSHAAMMIAAKWADIERAKEPFTPENIASSAITAYLSAMWKPIETAPKDGTRVLIEDRGIYIAYWSERCAFEQFKTMPGWQIFDCEDGWYSVAAEAPTHWMPLPAPPAHSEPKP